MHPCPTCKVPLHGYEETCPSCGTRQHVRSSSKMFGGQTQQAPGVNPMPFIVAFVLVAIGLVGATQVSWVGQLMRRGPVAEDPLEKMTMPQARQIIQSKVNEGLTAVGSVGKFTWTYQGQPSDINAPGPVELSIETALADPTQRKAIIDPIKDYMAKAQIPTLTMNDTKSHATWTYSVSMQSAPSEGEGETPAQ